MSVRFTMHGLRHLKISYMMHHSLIWHDIWWMDIHYLCIVIPQLKILYFMFKEILSSCYIYKQHQLDMKWQYYPYDVPVGVTPSININNLLIHYLKDKKVMKTSASHIHWISSCQFYNFYDHVLHLNKIGQVHLLNNEVKVI